MLHPYDLLLMVLSFSLSILSQDVGVESNEISGRIPYQLLFLESIASEIEDLYLPVLSYIALIPIVDPEDEDEEIDPPDWSSEDELRNNLVGEFFDDDEKLFETPLISSCPLSKIIHHFNHYNEIVLPKFGSTVLKNCGSITESWVEFNDAIYCEPSDIYALMTDSKGEQSKLLSFDRVIGNYGPHLVLYANFNDHKFKEFVSNLYDNSKFGKTRFSIRYIPQFIVEEKIETGRKADSILKKYEGLASMGNIDTVNNIIGGVLGYSGV